MSYAIPMFGIPAAKVPVASGASVLMSPVMPSFQPMPVQPFVGACGPVLHTPRGNPAPSLCSLAAVPAAPCIPSAVAAPVPLPCSMQGNRAISLPHAGPGPFGPAPVPAPPQLHGRWVPPPMSHAQTGDIQAWLDAACAFEMNTDFDVSRRLASKGLLDLKRLMDIMKEESAGKRTIQALADKLILHRLIDNLDIPQMPNLLQIDGPGSVDATKIRDFVCRYLMEPASPDVIVKPSHMSSATGVIVVSHPKPHELEQAVQYIVMHMRQFLNIPAAVHESAALRSLRPGFIAQPKYRSVVGFKTPLECRVVVLWGKARLGLWWWGRGVQANEFPQRNTWFVRRPLVPGKILDNDTWEACHDHRGSNPGFDKAVELFERNISTLASMAEAIAVAVGAPFLRADFFVGDPTWGVRLNEVAYGCGIDYRNLMNGTNRMVDDAPAIAQILQEGHNLCRKRKPPEYFLSKIGARGRAYNELVVDPLPNWQKKALDPQTASAARASKDQCADCAVPDELCNTTCGIGNFGSAGRSLSFPSQGVANLCAMRRCHSHSQPAPRSISFNWAPPRSVSFNGPRFP
eukprot:gnl/TRDRNA2_/TRDRNA2_148191_c1_seq1.p1 gnl/TRDRNA2_/TRDRNA2_148191_c1~~gnl/TRDRNA2_/TRDRNA2_148191_c1_seq1.p1  ORF type:complete len:597 (+),score=84.88 gnl/TRDRNA2_/TRDRNA2_148191_c1_seq1:71-1792(+)